MHIQFIMVIFVAGQNFAPPWANEMWLQYVNINSSFSHYTWFAANNDRTQIGSSSVFTNLCLFSSLPPSLLCLLCSFPPFSSFCLFSHLIFSRPYTSLTEVSVCNRRGLFAQQCRNENFFCCQNQSHILQSSYWQKVHIPRKGPCPVDSVHSLRGLRLPSAQDLWRCADFEIYSK